MRRILLVAAALVLLPLAPAGAQDADPTLVTYYLHDKGACDANDEVYADQEDTSTDIDGCGQVGAAGATDGFSVEFPGKVALGNVSLDVKSTVKATIYVTTYNPGPVSVEVGIAAGPASCSGKSAEQTLINTPATNGFTPFDVTCTFAGVATPKAVPTITLIVHSQEHFFLGYEGDHASQVAIHGNPAVGPAPSPTPTSPSKGSSPGLGLPLALALVAMVAVLVVRRRA